MPIDFQLMCQFANCYVELAETSFLRFLGMTRNDKTTLPIKQKLITLITKKVESTNIALSTHTYNKIFFFGIVYIFVIINSDLLFIWCSASEQSTPSAQPFTSCVSP